MKAKARQDYIKRLQDAWKTPSRVRDAEPDEQLLRRHLGQPPDDPDNGDNGNNGDDPQDARQEWVRNLSNAWRTPGRTDPSRATAVRRQQEGWLGRNAGVGDRSLADAVAHLERVRRATHDQFRRDLENAWRTGR